MKALFTTLALAVVVCVVSAEENRRDAPVPQPRTRLDPSTHTAIADPRNEEKKAPAGSTVTMDRVVVKAGKMDSKEPEQEKQPEGKFSLLEGGRFARKDFGSVRVEVGLWPYFNLMEKDDRFKSDKKHVGADFLRISW